MENKKSLVIMLSLSVLVVVIVFFFGIYGKDILREAVISGGGGLMLPLVVVSAAVDSINPCAFSILLLTIGFLLSLGKERSEVLRMGWVYIFGVFTVYVLIGLGILQALSFFSVPHFMAKIGALVLIILGLINIINEYFPEFPIKIKIPQFSHKKIAELLQKGSIPAIFILGVVVGMYEFPCTGGPYLMILGLLHDSATYYSGFTYLILYNLIFVFPLGLILLIGSNKLLLEKIQLWKRDENARMRLWGGVATIILGLIILAL